MKIGFVCGIFDLFHVGHILMLQECKKNCDYLIVAINKGENIDKTINPQKMPILFTLEERKLILESCKYVDEVLTYNSEEELENILNSRKIDVRFLGDDYKNKKITGEKLVPEIYFIDRSHGLSSSYYKKKLLEILKKK
jgi:glycerol-3-phosphate cytidylyltransferase